MGTVILGTGSCLPRNVVTNSDLEKIVDTTDEWITSRTGIQSRHIASGDEYTYKLSARAAEKALEMAGVGAEELDLIVVATISSHMLMPSSACFVQNEIGATNAFAWDLNAACSGFLYGIDLADKYVRADKKSKILVIGAETLSTRINWEDRNTCIIFGDGAGAAVVGYSESESGYIGSNLSSDGSLWKLLHMHAPESTNPNLKVPDNTGAHIVMEGREVFKHAVKAMEDAVRGLLEREQLTLDDINLVIPHQANIRILNKLKERLQLPEDKVFINVSDYGNTSAASIPIALDEAKRSNRISSGDTVLFCSFGGGFTWGASLIKW
ncbi:beta-ketoacyl-ACP synthase III [Desulfosediminicola flagellatus]|uniref:beta-ketoacyl-ACP synthase III n=1 Tax=Desulfosediminicola flagellatus TaxID=2569541 RepID=UPI0010AB98AB|nr:beta-ketoacyl-ACP synthase III [Desulfosediminicola flagellatus]